MPTELVPSEVVRIVWVYPDLLSTYGDRGNWLILAERARRRGLEVEALQVRADEALPDDAHVYLLGGGEDRPQALAAARLRADGGLARAIDNGAAVLAVCAGYQLIGNAFFAEGKEIAGLELVDLRSDRGATRAVGELAGDVLPGWGIPPLTGFENHGGRTHLGPGVTPLAQVTVGVGNDGQTEGVVSGKIIGTYAHGPALGRNPALADLLLQKATGRELASLDDAWPTRLRNERLAHNRA